jgi:chromosome segregation ATPase
MRENTQSLLDKLGGKVADVMQQLHTLKEENDRLRGDLTTHQAQNDAYKAQIEKLEAENAAKDREIEEIVNKIESILG